MRRGSLWEFCWRHFARPADDDRLRACSIFAKPGQQAQASTATPGAAACQAAVREALGREATSRSAPVLYATAPGKALAMAAGISAAVCGTDGVLLPSLVEEEGCRSRSAEAGQGRLGPGSTSCRAVAARAGAGQRARFPLHGASGRESSTMASASGAALAWPCLLQGRLQSARALAFPKESAR